MALPVTVRDSNGNDFHCTRRQWETLYAPRGFKLVADEDGRPTPAARRSSKRKAEQSED